MYLLPIKTQLAWISRFMLIYSILMNSYIEEQFLAVCLIHGILMCFSAVNKQSSINLMCFLLRDVNKCRGGANSVQIVQRHHFASHLKRMAVVVRVQEQFFAFVKVQRQKYLFLHLLCFHIHISHKRQSFSFGNC